MHGLARYQVMFKLCRASFIGGFCGRSLLVCVLNDNELCKESGGAKSLPWWRPFRFHASIGTSAASRVALAEQAPSIALHVFSRDESL